MPPQRPRMPLSAKRKREAQEEAKRRIEALGGIVPPGLTCGAVNREVNGGGRCGRPAGTGTAHVGAGLCNAHGGNSSFENMVGALMLGHRLARSLDITPWEALLGEVRRTAGAVAFLDLKVSEAEEDDELIGEGALAPWVRMRKEERMHLARVSKMALDAAVDSHLVAQMQLEGETIARVVLGTLTQLGLSDEIMDQARAILRTQLLAIEANALGVTREGETLEGDIVMKETE